MIITHTSVLRPLSGATQVSQYQKGKTNLDFTEARDSEWQWHQLGRMKVCISLQTDNQASTPPLKFFTGWMPFLPPNQQHQSTEGKSCYGYHTHTHPFNGPFSGTTQVSWYQKGKTNLDFTEARDSEWRWHRLGHMQVCTRSRQITINTPQLMLWLSVQW